MSAGGEESRTDEARASARLAHLYEISKLLLMFGDVERTVFDVLAIATKTLPLASAILIDGSDGRPRVIVWHAKDHADARIHAARERAEKAYAYLVGPDVAQALAPHEDAAVTPLPRPAAEDGAPVKGGSFILIPLVIRKGMIFGALQLEATHPLYEEDLMFVNATANQVAIALDRHRAWQRDIAGRDRAETELVVADRRTYDATAHMLASDRRRVSAEASMEKYAELVDNLDHAFLWEADARSLQLLYVSARVEKLLGHPRSYWSENAERWLAHVHPLDRDAFQRRCRVALEERRDQTVEHRAITRDGEEVWLHTGLHLADAGSEAPRFQAVSVDVTMAKRAEGRLREQLDFTRSLAESLAEGVLAVNLQGQVTFANEAAKRLLSASLEGFLVGRPFDELVTILTSDGHPVPSPLARAMEASEGGRSDAHLFRLADGTSFPARHSSAPLRTSGAVIGAILAFQDITERKRDEEALRAAVQTREHVLAIVSHDLRSPLSVIQMSATLLLEAAPAEDRRQDLRKKLEGIVRSSGRMARLIDDLGDFASLEAGRLSMKQTTEKPDALLKDALASFEALAASRQISLRIEGATDLPAVRCDRERVLQVFSNLVGNAVKVTPSGGAIVVHAEQRATEVVFSVSDTGPGIPDGDRDRIFQRYERGSQPSYKGTGLGLAIARGIIEAHGGKIWVESTFGSGAKFSFSLPVVDARSAREEGWRVLVVDDDATTRRHVRAVLEHDGFEVSSAPNGVEALKTMREGARLPDLIVLDLMMPLMDGWSFVEARDEEPELAAIPIVVVSETQQLAAAGAALRAFAHVQKPIDDAALLDVARRACRAGRGRSAPAAG